MPAVRWLHWDEAYRRRERLTVTVTRYCNARNAPPLYQFRFCGPRAKSTGKKIEANSKGDDRTRPRTQMKRDYHPVVRKYAGCSEYASARRGTLRSFYRDIFSLPATRRASFFRASKVERTCSLADTGREERERERERQGKISFNLLRFLPSPRPDLYGNYPSSVAAGKWTGQLMQASRLHNILIKYFFGLYNNIL